MKPQQGKFYTIHCHPEREQGETGYVYTGLGECISGRSNGGLYHFCLPDGQTNMFTEEEIIQEHPSCEPANRSTDS